jgi:hypothetical protein
MKYPDKPGMIDHATAKREIVTTIEVQGIKPLHPEAEAVPVFDEKETEKIKEYLAKAPKVKAPTPVPTTPTVAPIRHTSEIKNPIKSTIKARKRK